MKNLKSDDKRETVKMTPFKNDALNAMIKVEGVTEPLIQALEEVLSALMASPNKHYLDGICSCGKTASVFQLAYAEKKQGRSFFAGGFCDDEKCGKGFLLKHDFSFDSPVKHQNFLERRELMSEAHKQISSVATLKDVTVLQWYDSARIFFMN